LEFKQAKNISLSFKKKIEGQADKPNLMANDVGDFSLIHSLMLKVMNFDPTMNWVETFIEDSRA